MNYCPSQNLPFDTDTCEVCAYSYDECICPECQTCGEQGQTSCYIVGSKCGLVETPEQEKAMKAYIKEEQQFAKSESVYDLFADLYEA